MKYLILFLLATTANAASLITDTYPAVDAQPDSFVLALDGGAPFTVAPTLDSGGLKYLRYDLASVATGTHTITVVARNVYGDSVSTPFTFTKALAKAPLGLRIVP